MWTRELLKSNAKDALRRYYWPAFLICLVTALLCGGADTTINLRTDFEHAAQFLRYFDWRILLALLGSIFSLGFVARLFAIFVGNVLKVGQAKFFVESRNLGQAAPIESMLAGVSNGYSKVVLTMFLRDVYIMLWSLLLVVPGIIKSFEYMMIPYVLADCPELSSQEAFAMSKRLMDGHKMEAFVLQLSFLGWQILGALCCGIGLYFVAPYMEATFAEFYTALKETTAV